MTREIECYRTTKKEHAAVLKYFNIDFDEISILDVNEKKIVSFIYESKAEESYSIIDKYHLGKLTVDPKTYDWCLNFVLDIIMNKRRDAIQ